MRVGLIGVGEVGSAYAQALPAGDLHLCDRASAGRPRETAAALGLPLHAAPGPWLAECDVVIAAVTGSDMPGAAAAALDHLGEHAVYLDVGTASPDDLRTVAADFDTRGRAFVDGAIMGAIAISGSRCPVLLAGPAADRVAPVFGLMGAETTVIPDSTAGEASSLKLLRSVIVKGIECLAVESLTAAEHLGVRDRLMSVLRDIDDAGIEAFIGALVRTHIAHAARRGHEMVEAAAQLQALGFDGLVTAATPARYDATVAAQRLQPPPEAVPDDLSDALAWLQASVRRGETSQ